MEDNFLDIWKKFKLIDEEKIGLCFNYGFSSDLEEREQLFLLGLIILDKILNREAFKTLMQALWRLQSIVNFKEVGPNLFLLEFHDLSDLKKVKDGRPWSFDRYLFCITNFNHNLVPQDLPFNKELFWIQIHQLPLGMMNKKYGEFMGKILGEVEEVV